MRLPRSETSRSLRLRQGVILLVGAILIVLTIGASPTGCYWTPVNPNLDTSGLYLAGAGAGATIGMLLARRGFAVDPLGMAVTIAIGWTVLAFEERFSSVLGDARLYALLIGAVGLVNLLIGAFAHEDLPRSHRAPVGP